MLKEKINKFLSDKSICILGFGREGKSTLNYIKNNNISYLKLCIADKNEDIQKEAGIEYLLGPNYLDCIDKFDIVIKSPGISLKDIDLSDKKTKITSQAELFLKFGREKIIGITGTKGKSTTSSLIYQMLKTKYTVELVGNIGTPVLDLVDKYDAADYFVFELSSHQLELVDASPKIAILLNLYEEHLDYYKSYADYADAKRNIFKYQQESDIFVYNKDMEQKLILNNMVKAKKVGISQRLSELHPLQNEYVNLDIDRTNIKLLGVHNLYNLTVASTIAKILNINDEDILGTINSIQPLPHRLEVFGKFGGVTYIDDSISTIPEATISAMESIENIETVIIGGLNRGINYDGLIDYLLNAKVSNVILMYDSGKKIYNEMLKRKVCNNVIYAEDLERAVNLATAMTKEGKICLLSPAAASYGYFKNFEERGDKFKELVKKYSDK